MTKGLLLVPLLVLTACASITVSPRSINEIVARPDERATTLQKWHEAVLICNEFLASGYRKTLPKGNVALSDEGMAFTTDDGQTPIRIRCSRSGDLLIPFGMIAQERSDGFAVGYASPHRNREIDNTFFKRPSGAFRENYQLADTILHELTHTHFKVGTVSLPKTVAYYMEAIFLLRYRKHSMENLPYRTSDEFRAFVRAHVENQKKEGPSHTPEAKPHLGRSRLPHRQAGRRK